MKNFRLFVDKKKQVKNLESSMLERIKKSCFIDEKK